jgi:hypothetical protein
MAVFRDRCGGMRAETLNICRRVVNGGNAAATLGPPVKDFIWNIFDLRRVFGNARPQQR